MILPKYHVAKLGSNCLCLTSRDLITAVIEPVSDESLNNQVHHVDKAQAAQTQTAKALKDVKQARAVKFGKILTPQTPEDINRALWTQQPPRFGFVWFCVVFTIIYLIAIQH